MDRGRGIGIEGRLPWHLADDLKHCTRRTMGHSLVLGRRTWESIGRPLPGRRMLVVTRQERYPVPDGVQACASLDDALATARAAGDDEVFIAGGAGLYREALPRAGRIYMTRVEALVEADVRFPEFDRSGWSAQLLEKHAAGAGNDHAFRIEQLDRRSSSALPAVEPGFDAGITFLYVRDLQASSDFYGRLLDLDLVLDQGGCRIYRVAGDSLIGFCERDPGEDKPRGLVLTFVSEEVDGWAAKLRSAGVSLETEPKRSEEFGIYHFFFRDPDGYLLEIQRFLDSGWRG